MSPATPRKPAIGYLVSQFPSIHHTFILREVAELRRLGIQITTVSMSNCDRPPDQLSAGERAEWAATTYASASSMRRVLTANVRCALRSPLRYLSVACAAPFIGTSRGEPVWKGFVRLAQAAAAAETFRAAGATHFHAHFTSTVARLTARLSGLPWSVTVHGPAEFDDVVGTRLPEKVAEAAFTVVISHYGAAQVFRSVAPTLWPRVEVCHLGVDLDQFAPSTRDRTHRTAREPFVIACVARLAPVKGLRLLIEAIGRVRDAGVPAELRLVGDGPDRAPLQALVEQLGLEAQVHFEGWRTESEVKAILNSADAFAMTSFAEGIPVVLMEAMAMGVPCVATWVNGIPELIEHGVSGLLAPAADAQATADALIALYEEPSLASRLSSAGREAVARRFDLATNVASLARILERRLASVHAGAP